MLSLNTLWRVPTLAPDGPAPTIFDPEQTTFLGFQRNGLAADAHLFERLEGRARIRYGAGFPSPLGRQDRLWRTSESLAQFKLECAQRMNKRDAHLGVRWDIIVQGSARENPGQGLSSVPDSDLKSAPDALDRKSVV